jgi:hypothetical protein
VLRRAAGGAAARRRLEATGGVTTQDFIKFWGNFFAFVLLEMFGFSQGFKTFDPI